ncbi:MAG TPA: DUF418 domain-containing protein [Actinomycetaceae bacterium]|nr:DUF418 domain-containing protein [Actinomycetaceae bacterium]
MPPRIIAVDIARGIAVLGMFAAHLGVGTSGARSPEWLAIADGRPSASFAILAGVSIALFTGRERPPSGHELRWGAMRVLSRAIVIFAIGLLLEALRTPIAVILPSYAAAFVLVTPAIAARSRTALALAGVVSLALPPLVVWARTGGGAGPSWVETDLGQSYVAELFLTGRYPALAWSAYLLLGLAVGRLRLRRPRIQLTLAAAGLALVAVGYGGAGFLQSRLGPDASPFVAALVSAEPHDDTTFELWGNAGVFLLLLAVLLWLTTSRSASRVAGIALRPVSATGQLALSAYCLHIVAIAILGPQIVREAGSNGPLLVFIAVTLAACTLWRTTLGQGPIERAMRWLTVGGVPQHERPVR